MKTINKNLKYLKYLFWLGPFLVIMGLTAGVVSGTWETVSLGLILIGLVIIGLWLFYQTSTTKSFWSRRSTQASTNALISTVAVLAILGLINFLSTRYTQRIDLTETQLFSLAPQSQQVVQNLKRPVKALIFVQQPDPALRALLEEYQRQGKQFSFEFVNPQAQPQKAQTYGVQDFGDVYLESGQRRQFLQSVKFERLSEGRLTNGLEQIASDRESKIYFLQGHGEPPLEANQEGLSQAVKLLGEKNFTSQPLNLAQQTQIPQDAAVIVVTGPKQALLPGEVKALSDYLNKGGSLLLMIDPNTNPGFDSLLKDWGVRLDNYLAINASRQQVAGMGPAASLVNQYGEHPITSQFGNRYSVYPVARPIEITPVKGIQQAPLLITSPQTWAESDLKNQNLQFNPESGDRPGPLLLGVALSKPTAPPAPEMKAPAAPGTSSPTSSPATTPPTSAKPEPRLVVLGDANFAIDGLFGEQLNSDVFLNSVSWLSKRDDQVLSIRPKEMKNRRITMTQQQSSLVGWLATAILPLVGFGTAAMVWWKRR